MFSDLSGNYGGASADSICSDTLLILNSPALQINLGLATDRTSDYLNFLVGCLKERPLSEVANTQEVASRFFRAMQWQKQAIAYMEKVGEVRNGVAFFDLTEKSEFFYRYGPYYLWPDTRFAVAVIGMEGIGRSP